MNIEKECVECILNQVEKTISILDIEAHKKTQIRENAFQFSKEFSFSHTPPRVAKDVYEMMSDVSGVKDPFFELKQNSIEKAQGYVQYIQNIIDNSDDKIFSSLKVSVAGNVIDFGAKEQFELDDEIKKVFDTDFAINDYKRLLDDIKKNDTIMLVADNSGENVFDKLFMQTVKKIYPEKKFYYAVRGKAIINDITTYEARQIGVQDVADIIDSGVDTPGLEITRANNKFLDIYNNSHLIIAKGMGNYECLENSIDKNIYFLFKVKCDVVAKSVKCDVGDIILKHS